MAFHATNPGSVNIVKPERPSIQEAMSVRACDVGLKVFGTCAEVKYVVTYKNILERPMEVEFEVTRLAGVALTALTAVFSFCPDIVVRASIIGKQRRKKRMMTASPRERQWGL